MILPEDFIRETQRTMGEERFARLCEGLLQEPPVSIRLNEVKLKRAGILPRVAGGSEETPSGGLVKVPWSSSGYYLDRRPAFTFDPLLHAGAYYVQEASSMFIDHVVSYITARPEFRGRQLNALDLCAAPGGKSLGLRSLLPEGSVLYSNEPVRPRAQVLNENILKWGHPDVVVTNNYAEDYRRSGMRFDLVLADVPCSGEGMFRKDPQAIADWSLQKVEQCRLLQRDIIRDIWPCLMPGGILVYSTCTFNIHENEENVAWIADQLGAVFVDVPIDSAWGVTGSLLDGIPSYRFIPGCTRGEGLFMAVLQKNGDSGDESRRYDAGLRILSHGPLAPQQKGRDLVPDASEALSFAPCAGHYPHVAITYQQAVSYLRREAIKLPADSPVGLCVVTFNGFPLGFVKNIGSRANNLYSKEWAIKSTHVPSHYEPVV